MRIIHGSLLTFFIAIACASASVPIVAETDRRPYAPPATDDITVAWGEKKLVLKTGASAGDSFVYSATMHGEVTATAKEVSSVSSALSNVNFNVELKERKDSRELDMEVSYISLTLDHTVNGDKWNLAASNDKNNDNDMLWLNGKAQKPDSKGALPQPVSLVNNLEHPVAFARLGRSNGLIASSHRVDYSNSDAKNLPQGLIDPLVFLRPLFAGYITEKELAVGETLDVPATFALGSAGDGAAPYSLQLTLRKVMGKGTEALAAQFDVTAVPREAVVIFDGGVQAKAPKLTGTITLDVSKGVVLNLALEGTYETGGSVTVPVRGKIGMSIALKKA